MCSALSCRVRLRTLLLWAGPLAGLACSGGGGTDVVLPALSIRTSTSGVEFDTDGYSVGVDGLPAQPIGVNATLVVDQLPEGDHSVELTALAPNCTVQGDNPSGVGVRPGTTASVAFAITCGPSAGVIQIATATTGSAVDPDGFILLVDGTERGPIGVSGTTSVAGMVPGSHTVGLNGLAANCRITGENPLGVTVVGGETVTADFAISCTPVGPTVGNLQITTSTSGPAPDPDGYLVRVDGGASQPIEASATLALANVSAAEHTVQLLDVAANCTVSGTNPVTATVPAGGVGTVTFSVSCVTPPLNGGSLHVTTATTGGSIDADGFTVSLDEGTAQAIGANGSRTLSNLPPGAHSVRLDGLAANCTLSGDNPRSVTITAGQTAQLAFTVACVERPPDVGSMQISTTSSGTPADPNGYTVKVDQRATQNLAVGASITVGNLVPGPYSILFGGLAGNCTVAGDNPRRVTVSAGPPTPVTFAITCVPVPPDRGSVKITATTSGTGPADPDGYTAKVDAGTAQSIDINGNLIVGNLPPGPHSIFLGGLAGNCTLTGDNPRSVTVTAGQTVEATFAVTCAPLAPTLNLKIEGLYLTQSIQTHTGDVPLVQGRDGYLRVFVIARGTGSAKPTVRVRLFQNGALSKEISIKPPSGATPTEVREGTLSSSWNTPVAASLIKPGLSVLAEVDPGNAVEETDETDNTFPANGTAKALTVGDVPPPARIRFVPVQQGGLDPGNVSQGNKDQLIGLARRTYPLSSIETTLHAVFTATGEPLQPDGKGWSQLLTDLEALRVDEGSSETYFGVVKVSYAAGINGLAFYGLPGAPSAVGYDKAGDASRVVAHELGHVWGQQHTPCGGPPDIDQDYPHPDGSIGVYGLDVASTTLKDKSTPDIMGYCADSWASDYTYESVLAYRKENVAALRPAFAQRQPSLLIWGRIVNGRPLLEPAFQIVTRPHLPSGPGPYTVSATAADGSTLFTLSFDVAAVADDPQGARPFAFAVPLDQASAARLGSLRLLGPGGSVAPSRRVAQLRAGEVSESITARREGGRVALRWNASVHPMIMVRDPDTGEVLSFARGGIARVWTAKPELDLVVSDQVQSQRTRIRVAGP